MEDYTLWGYTPNESQFLNMVSSCGGWFVPSQYDRFRGVARGNAVQQLVQKGLRKGHMRQRKIRSRTLYRWLGVPPSVTVKMADDAVRRRLTALEFVISQQGTLTFYFCPDQKKEFLHSYPGVSDDMIPERLEHEPLFSDTSVVGFCFVDNGLTFENWFDTYKSLFAVLGRVVLMFISAHKRRIAAAKTRIEQWITRTQNRQAVERLNALRSMARDEILLKKMTPDEVLEYRQLTSEYGDLAVPQPGTDIVLREWWEPAANKYYSLFELPLCRGPAQQN